MKTKIFTLVFGAFLLAMPCALLAEEAEIMAQYTGYSLLYTLDFEGPCDITATNIENSCNNQSTTKRYIGISSNKAVNKSPVQEILKTSREEEQFPKASKLLREGKLLIQHNDKTYNAEGILMY